MTNTFDKNFIENLRQVHKEMMDERAFLEEMSDDIELTESDIFAMAHYFEGDDNGSADQHNELARGLRPGRIPRK